MSGYEVRWSPSEAMPFAELLDACDMARASRRKASIWRVWDGKLLWWSHGLKATPEAYHLHAKRTSEDVYEHQLADAERGSR